MKQMIRCQCLVLLTFIGITLASCNGESSLSAGSQLGSNKAGNIENATTDSDSDSDSASRYPINISPKEVSVIVGKDVEFQVTDQEGNDITDSVEWSIDNTEIAKNKENGTFSTLDLGTTQIRAFSNNYTTTATLTVELPEELEEGNEYTRLVYGIENCMGGEVESRVAPPCKGDCDDAWVVVEGDVTLGKANDKWYIVSNKDQDITVTTWPGTWEYDVAGFNKINPDTSLLKVTVRNKSKVKVKSVDMKMLDRTRHHPYASNWASSTQTEVLKNVKKWYYLDIEVNFKGTEVGEGQKCTEKSKLTKNRNGDDGFFRREERRATCPNSIPAAVKDSLCCNDQAISKGHCSVRKN